MRIHSPFLLFALLCLMPAGLAKAGNPVFKPVFAPVEKPAEKAAPPAISDEKADQVWKQTWRDVARCYLAWKGEYYAFPEYRKDYPSSVLIASHRVTEKTYAAEPALNLLTQAFKDDNGIDRKRTLKKDQEEVDAAVKSLPKVAPGEYGWIHSGKVVRTEGTDTVILAKVELLPADGLESAKNKVYDKLFNHDVADYRTKVWANNARPRQHGESRSLIEDYTATQRTAYQWWFAERTQAAHRQEDEEFSNMEWKVVGFKTDKIIKGTRWPSGDKGVQLAILGVDNGTVLAAPAAFLEKGMTEEEMLGLLKACELSKADFALLVKGAKNQDSKGWVKLVIYALEHGGKLPEPPKKAEAPQKPEAAKKPDPKVNDVELVK